MNDEFLKVGVRSFQALTALCQIVRQTISNSLNQFYSNQYVSAAVTPVETFTLSIQPLIDQFKLSTKNNFLFSFNLIRNTTAVNHIISALGLNYIFPSHMPSITRPISTTYNGCSCSKSPYCAKEYPVKNDPTGPPPFIIPKFYIGCYLIEALLQSTLECFYNEICIKEIQSYIGNISSIRVTPLNPSLPSSYSVKSTIQHLVDHFMIEQWYSSIIYEKYYNFCQPKQCIYTYKTKNSIIYIVTILFGLIGGLMTVLKLVVPLLVRFIAWIIVKRRRRIIPQTPTIDT
ncbi:unnamed protein product [Adineta ricciae]|nr:unnamed protein product [Adineta ricciae]